MLTNTADRYGLVSRLLHWLMALMIFIMLGVGTYMADLDKGDPLRPQLFGMHKAVGVTLLMLAVLRILWIFAAGRPTPPRALQPKEILISKAVIGLLYLLMLLTPVAGYLMSNAAGAPVSYFGLFQLPAFIGKSGELREALGELHEILAYGILALVVLHVLGALKHRLLSKDPEADVLKRML
jgi:cytochrome b561